MGPHRLEPITLGSVHRSRDHRPVLTGFVPYPSFTLDWFFSSWGRGEAA
jgi:hypothetical protein